MVPEYRGTPRHGGPCGGARSMADPTKPIYASLRVWFGDASHATLTVQRREWHPAEGTQLMEQFLRMARTSEVRTVSYASSGATFRESAASAFLRTWRSEANIGEGPGRDDEKPVDVPLCDGGG